MSQKIKHNWYLYSNFISP
ncbi:hypothetical protein YPPY53_0377, partial [Yersinia pestis PY-53]